MPLRLVEHPLARDLLGRLRDESCGTTEFRQYADQLSMLVVLEATRDLHVSTREIRTPLESSSVEAISERLLGIAVLRAGLGMTNSFQKLFPDAAIGHVGLKRDEETAEASCYYSQLPDCAGARAFLLDPMLATGGSACAAIELVQSKSPERISLLTIVASPEGVARLENQFPEVDVFTVAVDRELDSKKYIRPGLGDFGDRLFAT